MKLLKPTLWASIVFILPPAIFILLGWHEMNSPSWDINDSGGAQGFAFFVLSSLAALICVALVFPALAKILGDAFTPRKWIYLNAVAITLLSFIAAIFFWHKAGGSSLTGLLISAVLLAIPLAVFSLILLAPAMYIWLRVFKSMDNLPVVRVLSNM